MVQVNPGTERVANLSATSYDCIWYCASDQHKRVVYIFTKEERSILFQITFTASKSAAIKQSSLPWNEVTWKITAAW